MTEPGWSLSLLCRRFVQQAKPGKGNSGASTAGSRVRKFQNQRDRWVTMPRKTSACGFICKRESKRGKRKGEREEEKREGKGEGDYYLKQARSLNKKFIYSSGGKKNHLKIWELDGERHLLYFKAELFK